MDTFILVVRRVSQACGIAAAGLLAAATVVVCQMVVMRYFLGASTVWQTEFVIYSIVASTFIGAPYVLLHKGHVHVDLVPLYVKHRTRLVLALVGSLASLALCLVVAWFSAELQLLDDGEYGYCEACGVEIVLRRLEARPTATLCIDCKPSTRSAKSRWVEFNRLLNEKGGRGPLLRFDPLGNYFCLRRSSLTGSLR